MRISKEKYDALQKRRRQHKAAAPHSTRGSVATALAGTAVGLVDTIALSKIGFVQQAAIARPLVLGVVGFLARRRPGIVGEAGTAALAIAGYQLGVMAAGTIVARNASDTGRVQAPRLAAAAYPSLPAPVQVAATPIASPAVSTLAG